MKRILFVIVIIVLVFGIALYATRSATTSNTGGGFSSPSPYQLATLNSWEGIIPGKSTVQEIEVLLGKPEKVTNIGASQMYIFPSTNQYWKNEVVINNQSVVFIKERLFPPQEQSYTKMSRLLSESPTKLYGPDHDSGFYLFTYPTSGLAYFVHFPKNTVYEVWRFQPSSLKDLLSRQEFSGYYISPRPKKE